MIRNKLRSLRYQREMTQGEFANYLGVKQGQLNRWELQRMQPTIETAFKICRKLNITLEELFEYIIETP